MKLCTKQIMDEYELSKRLRVLGSSIVDMEALSLSMRLRQVSHNSDLSSLQQHLDVPTLG